MSTNKTPVIDINTLTKAEIKALVRDKSIDALKNAFNGLRSGDEVRVSDLARKTNDFLSEKSIIGYVVASNSYSTNHSTLNEEVGVNAGLGAYAEEITYANVNDPNDTMTVTRYRTTVKVR